MTEHTPSEPADADPAANPALPEDFWASRDVQQPAPPTIDQFAGSAVDPFARPAPPSSPLGAPIAGPPTAASPVGRPPSAPPIGPPSSPAIGPAPFAPSTPLAGPPPIDPAPFAPTPLAGPPPTVVPLAGPPPTDPTFGSPLAGLAMPPAHPMAAPLLPNPPRSSPGLVYGQPGWGGGASPPMFGNPWPGIGALQQVSADWWQRVGAALLDWLIFVVPISAIIEVIHGVHTTTTYTNGVKSVQLQSSGYLWLALIGGLLALVVGQASLMARSGANNGRTLGKQAAGYRIITTDGQPMTFGRALGRQALQTLSWIPLLGWIWCWCDYLWPLGSVGQRTLHDKMAATMTERV